eukprot:GHVS01057914.1.p1 GENE.GHVS01057914.1~~GHVS01057914.1.p1  ORF type:complete len:615 (+),score=181.91 GHVS01057914.1:506-2350(+)
MTAITSSSSSTHNTTSSTPSPTTGASGGATTPITKSRPQKNKDNNTTTSSLSSPLSSSPTTTAHHSQASSMSKSGGTIDSAAKKFSRDSLLRGRCPGSPPQVLRHLRMVPSDAMTLSGKRDNHTIVRSPPPGFDSVTSEHLKKVADEAVRDAQARMDQCLSKMTRLHPAAQEFIPCLYKAYNNAKAAAAASSPCSLFTSPNKQQSGINEWHHNSQRSMFPSPSRHALSSIPSPQTASSYLKDANNTTNIPPTYYPSCPTTSSPFPSTNSNNAICHSPSQSPALPFTSSPHCTTTTAAVHHKPQFYQKQQSTIISKNQYSLLLPPPPPSCSHFAPLPPRSPPLPSLPHLMALLPSALFTPPPTPPPPPYRLRTTETTPTTGDMLTTTPTNNITLTCSPMVNNNNYLAKSTTTSGLFDSCGANSDGIVGRTMGGVGGGGHVAVMREGQRFMIPQRFMTPTDIILPPISTGRSGVGTIGSSNNSFGTTSTTTTVLLDAGTSRGGMTSSSANGFIDGIATGGSTPGVISGGGARVMMLSREAVHSMLLHLVAVGCCKQKERWLRGEDVVELLQKEEEDNVSVIMRSKEYDRLCGERGTTVEAVRDEGSSVGWVCRMCD